MKILALESSGLAASAAVMDDGMLIGEFTTNLKKTHSQTLLPMVDQLLRMLDLTPQDLGAVAVSRGPGSFTGLRIGSATAKGLGLALGIPLIGVPTVDVLAYNLCGNDALVCPMMDARRQQVYTGLYTFSGNDLNVILPQRAASVMEMIDVINRRGERVIFLGDGVPVYRSVIEERTETDYVFAAPHLAYPRAGAVGALAEIYYREGKTESASAHRPEYLRVSQAERELMARDKTYRPQAE